MEVVKDRIRHTGYRPEPTAWRRPATHYQAVKRLMDIVIAVIALLVSAPVMAVASILVRLDSKGPIIHRRRVVGRNKTPFDAYKLRTMVENAEHIAHQNGTEFEANHKMKDDPRITRIGRILRKTSLDEIPQLLNVLKGEMSIVGPRMISFPELPKFGIYDGKILGVKPGITGLWQVSGRSDLSYEDRVRLNVYYVDHRSVSLDLWILWRTIPAVFTGHGAY